MYDFLSSITVEDFVDRLPRNHHFYEIDKAIKQLNDVSENNFEAKHGQMEIILDQIDKTIEELKAKREELHAISNDQFGNLFETG